jgi:hypothetical protein
LARVGDPSLFEKLDKIELIRATGVPGLQLPAAFHPRLGKTAPPDHLQTAGIGRDPSLCVMSWPLPRLKANADFAINQSATPVPRKPTV